MTHWIQNMYIRYYSCKVLSSVPRDVAERVPPTDAGCEGGGVTDHSINLNNVPDNFNPLQKYNERDLHIIHQALGSYVSTSLVGKIMHDTQLNQFPGGDFIFSCRPPQGAVLALPHGAELKKLKNIQTVREYAQSCVDIIDSIVIIVLRGLKRTTDTRKKHNILTEPTSGNKQLPSPQLTEASRRMHGRSMDLQNLRLAKSSARRPSGIACLQVWKCLGTLKRDKGTATCGQTRVGVEEEVLWKLAPG
ncbi:hypothetical protein B0H13DRAFT_1864466 [Mycena leptocephala]|nr:hypothetical protein B0H13DRAFT_1864466 [Mycena leptocephala]